MTLQTPEQKLQKELQAERKLSDELAEILESIKEVAEARMKSKVNYSSGSMSGDNEVYFRFSKQALTKHQEARKKI